MLICKGGPASAVNIKNVFVHLVVVGEDGAKVGLDGAKVGLDGAEDGRGHLVDALGPDVDAGRVPAVDVRVGRGKVGEVVGHPGRAGVDAVAGLGERAPLVVVEAADLERADVDAVAVLCAGRRVGARVQGAPLDGFHLAPLVQLAERDVGRVGPRAGEDVALAGAAAVAYPGIRRVCPCALGYVPLGAVSVFFGPPSFAKPIIGLS